MTVINTNTKALLTQNALATNQRELADAMAALSTGKRINVAGDDAAGLAITTRMTSYARGLDQAVRNAGDAITLLQTIEGATIEFTNMMQRMRELAIQAASDTNANAERSFLNLEFQQLNQEMNRIANNTQWNGFNVLDGTARDNGAWRFQVGADAEQLIVHSAIDLRNLIAASVQAQQIGYPVSSSLAAGEVASVTIDGTSFVISGAPATTQAGTYTVGNALAADETATLMLGGQTFSVTANNAVAQVTQLNFGNATLASTDTMSVTVNGVSYVLYDQQHDAMTGVNAAEYLASAINSNANVAQKNVFILSGTTVAATSTFALEVNGQNFSVAAAEHAATTASGMAVALASKINLGPLAQVAKTANMNDSAFNAGDVISVSLGGNTYYLASAHADAAESLCQLVSVINGPAVAQVQQFTMSAKSATSAAQVVVNGNTYTLSTSTGALTDSATATAMAAKIMGANVAQVERFSMSTHSVNINMGLSITINGTSYSVAAVDHTAVTQASAVALLANAVNNGQSAVSAFVSGAVLTLRAATAGTAFSVGTMDIGGQAALSNTTVTYNNTSQTAVSATASGDRLIITAVNAGTAFTYSAGNVVEASAVGAYNVTEASGFSASYSADSSGSAAVLILTATTAGTGFSTGASITIDGRSSALADTRPNGTAQTAVSATVSGAALILTATNAGTAFSVGNARTGAASVATSVYVGNLVAQSAVSAYASGAAIVITAMTAGTGFSVGGASLGSSTFSATTTTTNLVGGYTASQVTSMLANAAQSGLSAISVQANGASLLVNGLTANSAFATGVLDDGTVQNAFTLTASATAGGYTAASARALFASTINAGTSAVSATTTGSALIVTATTGGTPFSAMSMSYGDDGLSFTTIMANAEGGYNISTYAAAQETLVKLDETMLFINGERAKIGSVVNRLEYAIDNLRNISMNTKASRSQILDADYAEQSTELARTQIIQQAATSVLAQANSTQESVLKLLQ